MLKCVHLLADKIPGFITTLKETSYIMQGKNKLYGQDTSTAIKS